MIRDALLKEIAALKLSYTNARAYRKRVGGVAARQEEGRVRGELLRAQGRLRAYDAEHPEAMLRAH